jgi:hypothetical protein
MIDHSLDGNDGVGVLRNWGAGRDAGRCSRRKRIWCRSARRNAKGNRKVARSLFSSHGEPVHGRARERRKIDSRQRRLPEYASGCLCDRDRLHRKRLSTLSNERKGFFNRQQAGHKGGATGGRVPG